MALEKQLIKVRSEASDSRLDIADVIQTIDVLPALRSVERSARETFWLFWFGYFGLVILVTYFFDLSKYKAGLKSGP